MTLKNCQQCGLEFVGEDDICDNCRLLSNKDLDKKTRLEGTIEALALLKQYKELHK